MPFAPFHDRCPDLAMHETRSAFLPHDNDFGLPADEYAFIEMYCDDRGCDCRRVLLNVIGRRGGPMAVVNYGWDSLNFYAGFIGPDFAEELQGPNLLFGAPQSRLSPQALDLAEFVLSDPAYVDRCRRHYAQFRASLDGTQRLVARQPCDPERGRRLVAALDAQRRRKRR